jgi:hypothetical protein
VRRALILFSCVSALVSAPTARADAPLTETPFVTTRGGDAPTCLRPTGFASEFVTSEQDGSAGRVRLWSATTGGPVPGQVLRVPHQLGCAVVAADAAGGALLAVLSASGPSSARLLVATRSPGGRFGPLREAALTRSLDAGPSASIGAAGDGVVLVMDTRRRRLHADTRLRVVRVGAAGRIGRPEAIAGGD